jgi:calcium/proton exchanger cax
VLSWQHASSLLVFITACLGVLPLAGLMGHATEQIAERTGPTVGGLLNATFGNAAELIIAIVALRAGLVDLVKASITGSIPRKPAAHPWTLADRRRGQGRPFSNSTAPPRG